MTRSPLLLALALTLVFCTSASAAGLNLAWNDCGSFGLKARTFACNTNTGTNVLVASIVAPPGVNSCVAAENVLDLEVAAPALNPWLNFTPTGCRSSNSPASGVASGVYSFGALTSCLDPWNGQALSITEFATNPAGDGYPQLNRERMRSVAAVPEAAAIPLIPGREYYIFELVFTNAKTVGTGSCVGCQVQGIFELRQVRITQPVSQPLVDITQPNQPNSNRVVWQGDAAVPVRNRAWGAIKAIYH